MSAAAIDWAGPQRRLAQLRLYPGKIDGQAGEMTWIALVGFAAPMAAPGGDAVTLRGRALAVLAGDYGLTSAPRIAGFLSQTAHETGDYHRLRENLYYTSTASIRATWPLRFPTDASAAPYVRNPQALANKVYARPAEGNTRDGDGWLFRGGGDIQTTFRNGYRAAGAALGLPLEAHPELIETPAVALRAALFFWQQNNLNRFYDAGTPKCGRSVANCGRPDMPNPIGWDDVGPRGDRIMALLTGKPS